MAAPQQENWKDRLKRRWGLQSDWDFALVFTVFALTGSTTAITKRYVFDWLNISTTTTPVLLYILFYILYLLLAYQPILLFFGTLVGKFSFFWRFVKSFAGWLLKPFGVRL